ncbi:MAG: hypothetical protein IPG72_03535 [Ardenticatenales bacterium]|nr:hypothetical protein [Ardenticatenales bacterium]
MPLVYASAAGFNTIIYVQNGGLMCSSLEIWFKARDDCLRATICGIATLAPGETYQLDANDCVGPGLPGQRVDPLDPGDGHRGGHHRRRRPDDLRRRAG